MANVIKHKRGSGSDPVASDLVVGEVAIRTDVGKLFTKMDNGSVAEIAGGGSDIAINTLSSSSATGGGSATFNGSAYRFTLSAPPSVSAQQLLVSINGVIQKPVAGTGQPSEGFSVDGTDIILGDAPATGSDFFILTFKSLGVSEPADNSVTSAKIVDGAIVNADINASAAIAGTKISPDFGSQDVVTTGNITSGGTLKTTGNVLTVEGATPRLNLTDTNNNSDFEIGNTNGTLNIADSTNSVNRLRVLSNGTVIVTGNLDAEGGIDVTGAITGTAGLSIEGATVFNESGADVDFRVEGDTQASLFKVDAGNNRVGIGESDPLTVFQVTQFNHAFADSTSSLATVPTKSVARFRGSNNASGSLFIGNESTNARCYLQGCNNTGNGSIDLLLNPFGANVGIGTTSPSAKLYIAEAGSKTGGDINLNADGLVVDNSGGNTGITFKTPNTATSRIAFGDPEDNNAGQILYSQASNYFAFDTSGSERMRIDSSGRVLIGTTSGNDALVVDGGSDAGTIQTNSTNSNGNMMTFKCSGTSKFFIGSAGSFITGNSGTTNQGIRAEGHLLFATGGASQKMRLGTNGALGVGGNANRMIHAVQNSSNGTVGVGAFENGDENNSNTILFLSTVRNGTSGNNFLQCNRDQNNNGQGVKATFFIRTNGDCDSDTNSYGGISDIKLKENIVDAKSQWDDIKNIKVRNFNFKDNPNQKMLGVVAQEVETVSAGLVKDCPDENITSPGPEGTSTKSVKYSILYMKAIKALQEAQIRIETLESKVTALEAK